MADYPKLKVNWGRGVCVCGGVCVGGVCVGGWGAPLVVLFSVLTNVLLQKHVPFVFIIGINIIRSFNQQF